MEKQMFVGEVASIMMSQNKPYWWVTHYHDNKHIAQSPNSENLDIDESIYRLKELAKLLSGGRYRVQLSDNPKGSNVRGDVSHLTFTVGGEMAPAAIAGNTDLASAIATIKAEYEEKLKMLEKQIRQEIEMEKMKSELAELRSSNTGINGFINSEAGQQLIGMGSALAAEWLAKKLGSGGSGAVANTENYTGV